MKLRWMAAVAAVLAVTACGGGDDGPDLSPYIGVWVGPCITVNNRTSLQTIWNIRGLVDRSRINGHRTTGLFNNTGCSGMAAAITGHDFAGTGIGPKNTTSGQTDIVIMTFSTYSAGQAQPVPPPPDRVELLLLANGNLYLGDQTRIGADGYPDQADVSMPYRPRRAL